MKVVVKFKKRFWQKQIWRRVQKIDSSMDDLPSVKTLASPEQFFFSAVPLVEEIVLTKRKFLSRASTQFDPLRSVMPFMVRAKSLMQEVRVSEIDWDDQLQKIF